MFFQLLSMLGLSNRGERRAALAAREQFGAAHPGEPIAWVDIAADEPTCFRVGVHHGRKHPKECRFYAVDKETFKASEIKC
jgi:hypothetical protein